MSFVIANPQLLTSAARDLANIRAALAAANASAFAPTAEVLAAAADEVSTAIATVFGGHAQAYQAVSAQGRRFMLSSCRRSVPVPWRIPLPSPPASTNSYSAWSMHPPRRCWAAH